MMHPQIETIKKNRPCFLSVLAASACALSATASLASAAPQNANEVVQAFNALGLNAESLASIDVIGTEPATALDRLVDEFASYELIESLQSQIFDHQRTIHTANSILRDHADDVEARQALEQAEVQVILLSNQAHDTRVALVGTILDGLADLSLIAPVVHVAGPTQQLPPAYRVAVDTADEAKLLVWALKMQTMAQSSEFDLSSEASQAIGQAHAQFEVQSAMIRVTTYETPIQLTINEWALTH